MTLPLPPSPLRRWWLAGLMLCALTACWAMPPAGGDRLPWDPGDYFEGPALQLALASDRRKAEQIRWMIHDQGINPDRLFDKGDMPLVAWPVFNENPEGLRLLLENGADPNARKYDPQRKRGQYRNNAMVLAARTENPIYLKLLLDHGGDPNALSSNEESLMHVAYLAGRWQNIQLLLQRGARINEPLFAKSESYEGHDTVLNWYARLGNFDKAYWLLQHGADPGRSMWVPPDTKDGAKLALRKPILESIFWLPVKPHMVEWQRKCQMFALARGLSPPPMPDAIKFSRKGLGLPTEEKDIPLPSVEEAKRAQAAEPKPVTMPEPAPEPTVAPSPAPAG
ncbi:ankyrin repeat domain-containing protein [Lysobacter sp. 5GHs7-4]|uniref:ankyrin repeat domain-containing protein n=1 Tax=Lysobacter sp. 5GHs7-4 TaxID=2904253 RepID=UPI001E31947F|nr:ankyrin repeat domain-containing protein [Lysobacter sp. 5GHs7-4]UHQ21840.1 ankyrin repeat domain-containing protein [Lysobacter sp. 5GHs7-4]